MTKKENAQASDSSRSGARGKPHTGGRKGQEGGSARAAAEPVRVVDNRVVAKLEDKADDWLRQTCDKTTRNQDVRGNNS
jgi:hypothetical protein